MHIQMPLVALAFGAAVTLSAPVPGAIEEVKAVFIQPKAVFDRATRDASPEPKAVFKPSER